MSNAITNAGATGLAALASLRSGLAQVRASIPASVGGSPLLRLLKDGQWVAGSEDTVIRAGTEVIANPLSFQAGYSCWTNRAPGQGKNELLGEEMWGINAVKPPASTLPVHHDPRTQELCQWKDIMSVDMKVLDGAMAGQQIIYKASSVGGTRALSALLDAVMAKIDTGSEYVFPVIALSSDSYNHNSYGRTYVPVLEIVGWADMQGREEDADAPAAVDTVVKAAAAPARKAEPAPAPEPTPEPEAAPVGRRRRI